MSRLFLTSREMDFISDTTKEFLSDLVGQYIIYYPVSTLLTNVHEIYQEAIEKIFDEPFKLAVVAGQPDRKTEWNTFGLDVHSNIEILVQPKELLDRGLELFAGDFFIYGNDVYEIINLTNTENIYGHAEYERAVKLTGKFAKAGQFNIEDFKNLLKQSSLYSESKIQKKFVQQRGLSENEEGNTGDKRAIRERLQDDLAPIALDEGPRKIDNETENARGDTINDAESPLSSKFYNE